MNPSYSDLTQTYQIGQGVTAEADRRFKIAIGLIIAGGLSLGGVFAFRSSAPNWLKFGLFMGAIGSPLAGAYSLRRDQTLTRMGQQFEEASKQHLAADLNMAHQTSLRQKEFQSWMASLDIVERMPEYMRPGALNRWGLTDLVQFQDAPIDVVPTEVLPEGLVMPPGLMNQATLEESISDRASEELAIDWFGDWIFECGVLVGESGSGKTYLLVHIVLAKFIRDFGDRGTIYICDPDYGSSHGDTEPNTWLDLEVDRHVFTEYDQCFKALLKVSKIVEDRINETKQIAKDNQKLEVKKPKPKFDPVLLIIDEIPALMAAWTDDQKKEAIVAIANILRRGKKQNVTFKIGTQTLAVSRTCINQDVLQQTEIVLLWSSAQMQDNYKNIGLLPGEAASMVKAVSLYPQKTHDRYVCVRFADKKLVISGIPIVAPVRVESEMPSGAEPEETAEGGEDAFAALRVFWKQNPGAEVALAREFTKLTGRGLNGEQLEELKHYLEREE